MMKLRLAIALVLLTGCSKETVYVPAPTGDCQIAWRNEDAAATTITTEDVWDGWTYAAKPTRITYRWEAPIKDLQSQIDALTSAVAELRQRGARE